MHSFRVHRIPALNDFIGNEIIAGDNFIDILNTGFDIRIVERAVKGSILIFTDGQDTIGGLQNILFGEHNGRFSPYWTPYNPESSIYLALQSTIDDRNLEVDSHLVVEIADCNDFLYGRCNVAHRRRE